MKYQLKILDLHCASCVSKIESALNALPEIKTVSLNFANGKLQVEGDCKLSTITKTVETLGYHFDDPSKKDRPPYWTLAQSILALLVGSFFMFFMKVLPPTHQWLAWQGISLFVLLCMTTCGYQFFKGAFSALKRKEANMHSLIALGTGSSFLYSYWALSFPSLFDTPPVYYEAALLIMGLVNLGQFFESLAKAQTGKAISKLLNLAPKHVTIWEEGKSYTQALAEVKPGQILIIKPGETIPIDSTIIDGETAVDESLLTGESKPQEKTIGSAVFAGTSNLWGSLKIQATQALGKTVLDQIAKQVEEAQNSKPKIAKLVDLVCHYFVQVVIAIALITALTWLALGYGSFFALKNSVAVLVIACPCALGLATPLSIMLGMRVCATHGILIRNGVALEQAANIDVLFLDKTGTLTEGKPSLTKIHSYGQEREEELLTLAASLEENSEHIFAQSLVQKASKLPKKDVQAFKAFKGKGAEGSIDQHFIQVGSLRWFETLNYSIPQNINALTGSVALIAKDQNIVGAFEFEDSLKEGAIETVARLKKMKIKPVIISGDREAVVKRVATELGIDEFKAQLLPEDKLKFIKNAQGEGIITGFVGDGINDAPALAAAHVGFAMGAGTDIAIESADVTLMPKAAHCIADSIELSAAIVKNIKAGLFSAFVYNSLCIPIAAGIFYPSFGISLSPIFAAFAMSLSSLTVIANASRLTRLSASR